MGADIHGYVEVRTHEFWRAAVCIDGVVGRSYDAFGLLFGVRNSISFDPLFERRGIPEDVGIQTEQDHDGWGVDAHSASYATAAELAAVDWGVRSEERDERYTVLDEEQNPTGHKFGWASGWAEIIDENRAAIDAGEAIPNEDETAYVQRRRPTRREAMGGAWKWLLFEQVPLLTDRYGEENVRLVVWFDN